MVEANNPIHCALSLVGEPIMYPHIDQFLDLLHGRGISSYLVTNATFPDAIKTLPPGRFHSVLFHPVPLVLYFYRDKFQIYGYCYYRKSRKKSQKNHP